MFGFKVLFQNSNFYQQQCFEKENIVIVFIIKAKLAKTFPNSISAAFHLSVFTCLLSCCGWDLFIYL